MSFKGSDKKIKMKKFEELRAQELLTIRKLPLFGWEGNGGFKIDFEWPKEEDLKIMPLD